MAALDLHGSKSTQGNHLLTEKTRASQLNVTGSVDGEKHVKNNVTNTLISMIFSQ